MTDDMRAAHERWRELAVGHAMSALEPADDAELRAHLAGCADCRELVAATERAMAELAMTVPAAAPPPGLRARILDAAREAEQPAEAPPPAVSRLPLQIPSWLVAAAAVVLLAVVAVGAWLLVGGGSSGPSDPVADRCAAVRCPTVQLTSQGHEVATAMVLDGVVYVRPDQLPRNDASRDEYVLWRLRPGASPAAVGGFDVGADAARAVAVGQLGVPLGQVSEFALTREPGRTPPPAPTTAIVAAGSRT